MPLILSGSSGLSGNVGTTTKEMLPAGTVLQVVQAVLGSSFSTSSTSPTSAGLQATITPLNANSKILVSVCSMLRAGSSGGGNCYVYQMLWRGAVGSGTVIHDGYPIIGAQNTDVRGVGHVNYLDSPATSSAVTYSVSIHSSYAGAVYMNSTTTPSTITLTEIKG